MKRLLAVVRLVVVGADQLELGAADDVARQAIEEQLGLEPGDVRRDLGQVLVRDLGRRRVDRFLQPVFVAALVGAKRGQPLADRHQVARPEQRVAADVLERVFLLARVDVGDGEAAEEGLERVAAHAVGLHHPLGPHQAHVVDEDLAQRLRRVDDVDRAAAVLLDHRRALRPARVRLLADRREHLQVVVDAAQLVRDLDQAELREVPDVGRQLAGHARARRQLLDVLVEVLVDAVDEDRQRRVERAQARHQVAVGVGGAALQLARREVEQADEVVDDAVQPGVGDQAAEAGADLEVVERVEVLERRHRDRRQPDLRPGQRRGGEQGDRLAAEDLVADRLVEQVAARQADRVAFALVEDALGLEQQRLAEALGADDDELVVAPRREEGVDLGRAVEQRLVEILGHPDVVGIHGPRAHRNFPSGTRWRRA